MTDHRQLGVDLFKHVWTLPELPQRTLAQGDALVHAAHASRYHWGVAGQTKHRARGEWQISRVYAALGRPEPALHHAKRCLELLEATVRGPDGFGPRTDERCDVRVRFHNIDRSAGAITIGVSEGTAAPVFLLSHGMSLPGDAELDVFGRRAAQRHGHRDGIGLGRREYLEPDAVVQRQDAADHDRDHRHARRGPSRAGRRGRPSWACSSPAE